MDDRRTGFKHADVFRNILNHMLIRYIFQPLNLLPKKCLLVNRFRVQEVSKLTLVEDLHQSFYTPFDLAIRIKIILLIKHPLLLF